MTRIYIAGSSSERLPIASLMAQVREVGYVVTYDWVASTPWDRVLTDEELTEQARLDLEAIRTADVLWYVVPAAKSEGSATELGMALAFGKHVVVSGPINPVRIFPRLANHIFRTHEKALAHLKDRAPFTPTLSSGQSRCGSFKGELIRLCSECLNLGGVSSGCGDSLDGGR